MEILSFFRFKERFSLYFVHILQISYFLHFISLLGQICQMNKKVLFRSNESILQNFQNIMSELSK